MLSYGAGWARVGYLIRRVLTVPIVLYRHIVSPWLGPHCIYTPTCSHYAEQAVLRHGLVKGVVLALARVTRCAGGLFVGGEDPVPEQFSPRNLIRNYRRFRRRRDAGG